MSFYLRLLWNLLYFENTTCVRWRGSIGVFNGYHAPVSYFDTG